MELPSARHAPDLLNRARPGRRFAFLRADSGSRPLPIQRLFNEAAGSETPSMKHQIIAGAGLAAVIAFCSYMIVQLDAHRSSHAAMTVPATIAGR